MQSKFSDLASLPVAFSHFLCIMYNFLCLSHLCSELAPFAFWAPTTVTISSSVWVCCVCLGLSPALLPLLALFIIKTNNIYSSLCWLQDIYLSSKLSISVLGPTHPPLQWVSWTLSPGLKWLVCEADQSLQLNVKVTNDWSYTYTFPCAFITFREKTLPWLRSCLCPVVLFLVVFLITLSQM